ncbi:MAG: hypothetical protein ABSC23_04750 [Bryobacteraceae bacterium]
MRGAGKQLQTADGRLKRLAADIDALAEKDEKSLRRAREIAALRRAAAIEIHRVCASFVAALNGLLSRAYLTIAPPDSSESDFQRDAQHLIQIGVRGRILQIVFEPTPELLSTEDFRVPYILAGSVRAFNQDLLDKNAIEEHLLFYTVERERNMWRFFDARTHRSGPFDRDYLTFLMERLV